MTHRLPERRSELAAKLDPKLLRTLRTIGVEYIARRRGQADEPRPERSQPKVPPENLPPAPVSPGSMVR